MRLSIFLACFGFFAMNLSAQQYDMSTTPITDCSGFYNDPGGSTGDYGSNLNITQTLCSDASTGTHVQLFFSSIDLGAGDDICFYDGTSTAAPQLVCYSQMGGAASFSVQATAANVTGCMTVVFTSDGAGNGAGWAAQMGCIPACQNIFSDIVSSTPAIEPADTGYIDICPGQNVLLTGTGIYPQNGVVYQHSNATTTFEWQYGDGDISYGPNASHQYTEPGGYVIQLYLVDQFGCKNLNLISQRVRVSPYPEFALGAFPPVICVGDTVSLAAIVNTTDTTLSVSVNPTEGSFGVEAIKADSVALPDGVGSTFISDILFSQFTPGQVLTDINDLESICVNMEHSWMHDLEISITCPNGTNVILHNVTVPNSTGTAGETFLGVPNDPDNAAAPNAINTPWGWVEPGEGMTYCWSPTSTIGTFREYADANNPQPMPELTYEAFGNLNDLLGCPLNGNWAIEVSDNWGIDNGFIFWWSLNLDPSLYPEVETFTPQFVDYGWNTNPTMISQTQTSFVASPQNAGTASYSFFVENDFGCVYDTTVNLTVLPFQHPDCYSCEGALTPIEDTLVCGGNSVILDATYVGLSASPITFEAFPDQLVGNANHPYNNPFVSGIDVNSVFPATVSAASIQSVCISYIVPPGDFISDVRFALRAPNGSILDLSSNNGNGSNDFINTCFTPTASTSIVGATAPFIGPYIPEGAWSILNGSPINGTWQMLVSDGLGPTKFADFQRWSIKFATDNIVDYAWTPTAGLSCTSCPNPTVTSTGTPTTYIVTTEDTYGCVLTDSATVAILPQLPAPVPYCGNMTNGILIMPWDPVPNADTYLVSVNGGPWIAPTGADGLSHSVFGLANFTVVNLQVQAISSTGACNPSIGEVDCIYINCGLNAQVSNLVGNTCPNSSNGQIFVSAFAGAVPISYTLDAGTPGPSTTFTGVSAGPHLITIIDGIGCVDTLQVTVPGPPPIIPTVVQDSVQCHGGTTGAAMVSTTGGTPGYTYQWSTFPVTNGPNLTGVGIGNYTVTVRDANNCTVTAITSIFEPAALTLSLAVDSVQCFGQANGSIAATTGGGVGTYAYAWNVPGATATLINQPAGPYTVTVTDANACTITAASGILQPSELQINVLAQPSACSGINNGSATLSASNGTSPYTYLWTNGQTTTSVINLPAGNIGATVTDANGCTANDNDDVLLLSPLVLSITSDSTLCAGSLNGTGTVTVSGGTVPYIYTWDNGNVNSNATNLSAGVHTVTVLDAFGCLSTATTTVLTPSPVSVSLANTPVSCAFGSNGTVTSISNGGTQPYSYSWAPFAGNIASLTNVAAGVYSVTATDSNGCTSTATTQVIAPAAMSISSINVVPANCFNATDGSITVNVTGGISNIYNYNWSAPGQSNINFAGGLEAGNYFVTITDANNCSITTSATITQPTELLVTLAGSDILCFGGTSGVATALPTGGSGGYTYQWTNTSQTTSSATNLAAGNWQVIVTDANNCAVAGTITLTQPNTPVGAVAFQTTIGCNGLPQGAASVQGAGGTPAYTYSWLSGSQTSTVANLAAGLYTVTVTDANSCTGTTSITITELALVVVTLAPTNPNCFDTEDGKVSITQISGGSGNGLIANFTYQWSTFPTQFFATATNLDGAATYSVTVTDFTGCIGTASAFLDQPSQLQLTVKGNDALCFVEASGTAVATAISDVNDFTYQWSINANSQTSDTAQYLLAGTYFVTATDGTGCTITESVSIGQPTALDIKNAIVSPNDCFEGAEGAINLELDGGTPNYSVMWSDSSSGTLIENLVAGQYIATVTDDNGCQLIDTFTLIDPQQLQVGVDVIDVTCYGGHDGSIILAPLGGQEPYFYGIDSTNMGGAPELIGLTAEEYITYVRDANGCYWRDTVLIGENVPMTFELGADQTIFMGDPITLLPTTANVFGAYDIFWDVQDDSVALSCYDCLNPTLSPFNTTIVTGIITDENGCEIEDQITIFVYAERRILVPTGFSPDGDGNNDLLTVHGKNNAQVSLFRIYDRWGTLVYEDKDFPLNDTSRGWNGKFKGMPMDPSVFVWYVEAEFIDGVKKIYKGETTLIR